MNITGIGIAMKKILLALMLLTSALASAFSLAASAPAPADGYPDRPIKIIVPYPPGGSVDTMARILGEKLQRKWGQPVIVENRGGAGGNIGAELVWRSAPDGYTLLFAASGPYAINKALYGTLGYEPEKLTPISVVSISHMVLIAHPRPGLESLQQMIAYAKANPGKLTYASSGKGTISHLTAEIFKTAAGIKMTHVPYKGSGPAMVDILAGNVDLGFVELSSALPYVRSDKVRALGVSSEKRKPVMPDVPAIAEVLPGFVSSTWFGMAAAPKTPMDIANKLSSAVAEALKQPAVVERFNGLNIDAVGGTPAEMAQFMKLETERWGKVVRDAGPAME
ncbi:MAG TPA: tripartite tricarboxylate transporter substrate binding protein [Herbaspirillum sp.]|jgi:tripartite-type tricarboxylate transporter receptor subunit TctC